MENKNIVLKLPENERKELIDYYKSKLDVAILRVTEIKDILSQLGEEQDQDYQTSYIKSGETAKDSDKSINLIKKSLRAVDYNNSWSWTDKVKFILLNVGRCLTTKEIVEELEIYDSNLEKANRNVSNTISTKVSSGLIFNRYKIDHSNSSHFGQGTYFTGLIEWFDQDGNLIDEKYKGKE